MIEKEQFQGKKLIAFDLFWTCVDHHSKIIRIPREIKDILTTNPITIEEAKDKYWEQYEITDELIENIRRDIEWTFLFPETLETLKYLKSKWYKIAVVSNLWKDYSEPLHRLIPEWIFDYEVLSFDVWARKPDPEIYEYLRKISKIDFKDMIFVWDTLKADVIWPNDMWITPIHVNRTEEWWIKEAEKLWIKFIQISTLADLKNIL